jgi:ribosome-associated protein YbcJ (S4-like RNA binding protein)
MKGGAADPVDRSIYFIEYNGCHQNRRGRRVRAGSSIASSNQ